MERIAPLWPMLRLAAWKIAGIPLPKDAPTGNPLAALEPAAIAEILAVSCAMCSMISRRPELAIVG